MSFQRVKLGKVGEDLAAVFLQKNGYKIIQRNFKNNLGEIDIIAKEDKTVCFVEVKTRTSDYFGEPVLAISPFKQRKLSQVALSYLKNHHLMHASARFDIVSITNDPSGKQEIEVLKNAFELSAPFAY